MILHLTPGLNATDPAIKVRFSIPFGADSGSVAFWNTGVADDARNPATIDQGGNRILGGNAYSLQDLGYDPTTGEILVFAEGVVTQKLAFTTLGGIQQNHRPNDFITATVVVNGNSLGSDSVKYEVVRPDSFLYQLQTRREVRDAVAAWNIYAPTDLPDFGLKLLQPADLIALGVPQATATLLNPAGNSGVPGFRAAVYRDFVAGEHRYILAFAGTDDDLAQLEWDDWQNNIAQGLGWSAPQYNAAMEVGFALGQVLKFQNGALTITGHSLGGGLASAAAVVGGFRADTFNAAGLNIDTLYVRNANDDPIPNGQGGYVELYAGSLARYNNAATLIEAYYTDWDIISAMQDVVHEAVPAFADALGHRVPLDGPYDLDMAANITVFTASILAEQYWVAVVPALEGVVTMTKSHFMQTVAYGLLAQENFLGVLVVDALGYNYFSW